MLAALTLSGCIKENDSYKELQQVYPGMNIYSLACTQNRIAMLPANAGMRVAILAAEVAKQQDEAAEGAGEVTVADVKYNNQSVLSALFGNNTEIEEVADGYELTFDKSDRMSDGFYWEGTLLIETGGAPQLTEGAVWNITLQPGFKLYNYSAYTGEEQVNMEGGTTSIIGNQDGSCTIRLSGIAVSVEGNKSGASSWSTSLNGFVVRPSGEDVTLAYSSCKGKTFDVSGSASGPSLYANGSGTSPLSMSYSVEEGVFLGLQIINGTEECEFTSLFDYDMSAYPDPSVRYVWTSGQSRIYYNGYVYPEE